ncbi:S-layer homology domain-containing protein [Paenibacillus woosongensis]|uniref:S-layer homology domain-containing protein n=1 Tax=Paenibacillus woosongensis TaxID=307580 RepID=UPI0018C2807D|nr:S-layer homology domain-containing protein [Paenibacillus woosongensis]
MNKKLFAKVITAAALLGTLASPASATTFITDINGSYAKDAIQELVDKGIINGRGDGRFDPTGHIQRQDFAIILAKSLGLDVNNAPAAATFSDVPQGHYSFAAVEAAVQAGLIHGYGNHQFGNGDSLSRQDMAVIFTRALGVDVSGKGSILTFTDKDDISSYAKDAVAAAVELGLIQGNTDGSFSPLQSADRQSVALVASKFIRNIEEQRHSQQPPTTPPDGNTPPSPNESSASITPETKTPTTGSSNNGSSGGSGSGSGGSGSERDTTAPIVNILSETPVFIGSSLIATSNETGYLYLIPRGYPSSGRAELEVLVAEGLAKKVQVTTANTPTPIETDQLEAGIYNVFAVDRAGNLSRASSDIELKRPLSLTLAPGASFVLNPAYVYDESIVTIVDDSMIEDNDPYTDRNINSFFQVQREEEALSLQYNPQEGRFHVLEEGAKVGYILISSESELIEAQETERGVQILLKAGADEATTASLKLTLFENEAEVSSTILPVILDAAPPTVTDSVYSDGVITITASEPLVWYDSFEINISHVPVNSSGSSYDLMPFEHFTPSIHNGNVVIILKDEAFRYYHPLQPGDQFEITLYGIGDYARNMIGDEVLIVEIP